MVPVGEDRDVRAEPLDDLHHVAGEDDRAAAGHVPLQDVADQRGRHRVDRLERLVQHQQPRARAAARRPGRSSSSCRPSSRPPGSGRRRRARARPAAPRPAGRPPPGPCRAAGRGTPSSSAPVSRSKSRTPSGSTPSSRFASTGSAQTSCPSTHGLAGVRPQQPDGHRQGGGLAGAVRAEQAVEGAGRHVEVDAGDRDLAVELFGQATQGERRVLSSHASTVSGPGQPPLRPQDDPRSSPRRTHRRADRPRPTAAAPPGRAGGAWSRRRRPAPGGGSPATPRPSP